MKACGGTSEKLPCLINAKQASIHQGHGKEHVMFDVASGVSRWETEKKTPSTSCKKGAERKMRKSFSEKHYVEEFHAIRKEMK